MKIFLVFPGAIAILLGAILILAPIAPMLQRLLGSMLLVLGTIIAYYAIFEEDS